LPESFREATVTQVSFVMLEGTKRLPSKPVLAKARVVTLDSSPQATYEDDYVSIAFSFSGDSESISISGRNKTHERLGLLGDWKAVLAPEVQALPMPPASRNLRYGELSSRMQGNTMCVEPASLISGKMEITDIGPCRSQANALVEVEQDPVCKMDAPAFKKYSRLLDEGYLLIRVLLPVQIGNQVRDYVFTFVMTNNSKAPKKKDPNSVVV